ncbi:neuroendocrine convertase 1-like [Eriocheir sinensis]|uniref:neuroendocrine convertase 1-like n=1 Tax=Eriocheir sinensis TaxID=95602 RepID=UPI0021C5A581|nr:neuroendocrine convertase 1-like [Eriocheir sinensis]
MPRFVLLLLALCLVVRTKTDPQSDDEEFREVRDALRKFFARGVDPGQQKTQDISPASSWNIAAERRRQLIYTEDALHDGGATPADVPSGGHGHRGHDAAQYYLNEWVVHLTGGPQLAAAVAKDLGYHFLGQVGGFSDVYRLVKTDHPARHRRAAPALTRHLNAHAKVVWAEQQFAKERTKRSVPLHPLERSADDETDWRRKRSRRSRVKGTSSEDTAWKNEIEKMTKKKTMVEKALAMERIFNDELWDHQWYLFDTRTRSDLPRLDLRVVGAWLRGVSGRGVRVQVLDDGLEWRHEDLRQNYDPEISTDLNDNKSDPSPRYDPLLMNSHGTRCAGEIAMVHNNRKCGVGVAFEAKIGGVRMLDGPVSDVVEGLALTYALGKVDVVSCSWGPLDDGRRVEGPGRLAEMSLQRGIEEGRGGKGTIYVWAAGNGGAVSDNCNCDGYTSSIGTLTISSATETGNFPWYGELCPSTMATAYSSGAYTDQKIATTDLNNTCTIHFTGTSAAAPLAAGIVALALEANPELTWRDMQHAVVWSSDWSILGHNQGWTVNGRGLRINPRFGFGMLSAESLVNLVASNWTRVPEQRTCTLKTAKRSGSSLHSGGWVSAQFSGEACEEVRVLEHVQVVANIEYSRRGALTLALTSPQGTRVELLTERLLDDSTEGFTSWPFTSVLTWGEDPRGFWDLNVSDSTTRQEQGSVGELELILYGTSELPEHMKQERTNPRPAEIHYEVEENEDEEEDEVEVHPSSKHLSTLLRNN